MSDKAEPQEKSPIDPAIIGRISKLELRARLVVEGYVSGLHRSPYRGFSVEFAEHREYAPGDDLRYLDWKVFGKSDRYYVKRYEEETNLLCHVVLDISESMDFGTEGVRKFDYAATVAASLAHLVVEQSDAAGLVLFDDDVRAVLQPGNSTSHLKHVFDVIEKARPKGRTNIGKVLVRVSEQLRKRGLVVVISDLVGDVEDVLRGLRQLRASYLSRLEAFRTRLRAGCLAERIDVVEMSTRTPLDVALTSYLSRRAATERAR